MEIKKFKGTMSRYVSIFLKSLKVSSHQLNSKNKGLRWFQRDIHFSHFFEGLRLTCDLLATYLLLTCDLLATYLLLTCHLLATYLRLTCDLLATYLLLTCDLLAT